MASDLQKRVFVRDDHGRFAETGSHKPTRSKAFLAAQKKARAFYANKHGSKKAVTTKSTKVYGVGGIPITVRAR